MSSRVRTKRPADDSTRAAPLYRDMVRLSGGTFQMGSDRHYPEEAPVHLVTVSPFWIDRTPVTNRQFAVFVAATGYLTVAERVPNPTDYPGALPHALKPGSLVFRNTRGAVDLHNISNWWEWKPGAYWRHPEGKGGSVTGRLDYPVLQVAFEDAEAYARWQEKLCRPRPNGSSRRARVTQGTEPAFRRTVAWRGVTIGSVIALTVAIFGPFMLLNWHVSAAAIVITCAIILFYPALHVVMQAPPGPPIQLARRPAHRSPHRRSPCFR